jgi:hypothetical protein
MEKSELGGACSTYGEKAKVYTGFWWENLRKRGHLEDPGVDDRMILKSIFRRWKVGVRTRSSWLRIGTDGGQL